MEHLDAIEHFLARLGPGPKDVSTETLALE